ncbi:hypothetical protein Bbelb_422460 [Branchiostoma belcheri]|nr:hypothetical protein Bbelb_422460 [Branchiostoma belcheri]
MEKQAQMERERRQKELSEFKEMMKRFEQQQADIQLQLEELKKPAPPPPSYFHETVESILCRMDETDVRLLMRVWSARTGKQESSAVAAIPADWIKDMMKSDYKYTTAGNLSILEKDMMAAGISFPVIVRDIPAVSKELKYTRATVADVGRKGGELEIPGFIKLLVPPGVLQHDTRITVSTVDVAAILRDPESINWLSGYPWSLGEDACPRELLGQMLFSPAFNVNLHGAELSGPVEVQTWLHPGSEGMRDRRVQTDEYHPGFTKCGGNAAMFDLFNGDVIDIAVSIREGQKLLRQMELRSNQCCDKYGQNVQMLLDRPNGNRVKGEVDVNKVQGPSKRTACQFIFKEEGDILQSITTPPMVPSQERTSINPLSTKVRGKKRRRPESRGEDDGAGPSGVGRDTQPTSAADMQVCFEKVIAGVSHKWDDLARKLGFSENQIDGIYNFKLDQDHRCGEMLRRWRNREATGATLQVLKQALISIGERLTADSLASFTASGGTTSAFGRDTLEGGISKQNNAVEANVMTGPPRPLVAAVLWFLVFLSQCDLVKPLSGAQDRWHVRTRTRRPWFRVENAAATPYACSSRYRIAYRPSTCQRTVYYCCTGYEESEDSCVPKSCVELDAPEHGGRVYISGGRYYGDVVTFQCSSGFVPVGSSERTCQADQTWSGTDFSCHLPPPYGIYKDDLTGDCQLVSKMPRKAQKKSTRQDPKKRAAEDTRAASDDEVNRRCTHLQRASTACTRQRGNRTEIVRCRHVQLTYHLRNVRCTQPLTARRVVQTTYVHLASDVLPRPATLPYEHATYGLRESNFTIPTCNCCTDSARSTCVPRTVLASSVLTPHFPVVLLNDHAEHTCTILVYKDDLTGDCQLVSKMPKKAQKKTTRQDQRNGPRKTPGWLVMMKLTGGARTYNVVSTYNSLTTCATYDARNR